MMQGCLESQWWFSSVCRCRTSLFGDLIDYQYQQIIAFISHLGKCGSCSLGFGLSEKIRGKLRNTQTVNQIKMSILEETPVTLYIKETYVVDGNNFGH